MGITVYSLLWVMQDFDHQQYEALVEPFTGTLKGTLIGTPREGPEHPPPRGSSFAFASLGVKFGFGFRV